MTFSEDLNKYIREVRHDRGGSLSGMSIDEVVSRVANKILSAHRAPPSVVRAVPLKIVWGKGFENNLEEMSIIDYIKFKWGEGQHIFYPAP